MLINMEAQLKLNCTNTNVLDDIKANLDYVNPDYAKLKRMGYPIDGVSPRIRMYDLVDGIVHTPRLSLSMVRGVCAKHGEKIKINDLRATCGEIEVRLKDLKPFWYQDESIIHMAAKQQGIVVAPCLVGSTIVNVNRGGNGRRYSIKEIYDKSRSRWDKNIKMHVRSYNGEHIVKHPMQGVVYSGYKEVYKMTLANGKHVTGTANHKIMTDSGWTEIGDCLGEFVMCDTPNAKPSNKKRKKRAGDQLTVSEHLKIHSEHTKYNFNQGIPEYSECVSVEYIGMEDVYDIVCEDPYRNFVANGIVCHNCGSGKSIIGIMFIAQQKKPTIIVVHTLELFKQWEEMIQQYLVYPDKIGKIGGGRKAIGNITIAMIQTLSKLSPKDWEGIKNRFEIMLGDEAHHFGAESYTKIMKNINAKYRLGLTATPKRKDRKDFIIHNHLGNVIYEITDNDLKLMGRSLSCKVRVVDTGRIYNYTKLNEMLSILNTVISKDENRNKIILNCIHQDIEDNKTILVLVDRVIQGKILYKMLKDEGIDAELISGSVNADTRSNIKTKMKDGNVQVLVANKAIAAEGLDIPTIDSVHICFNTSNVSLVKQMIGRGRRALEGKEYCRVWVYKDKVCTIQLDANFKESLKEMPGFKYSFQKLRSWFTSQNFEIEDCNKGLVDMFSI